jgi:hypothetical protein
MNAVSDGFSLLISLCFTVQISELCNSDRVAKMLYHFNQDCLWTKFGFRPFFSEFLVFVKRYLLSFSRIFDNRSTV